MLTPTLKPSKTDLRQRPSYIPVYTQGPVTIKQLIVTAFGEDAPLWLKAVRWAICLAATMALTVFLPIGIYFIMAYFDI